MRRWPPARTPTTRATGARASWPPREHGVVHPLLEAGLGKADVRALAHELGVPSAAKPASPCLASRVPYGTPVDPPTLARIDAAEQAVRALGFPVLRVRHHGELGKLELPEPDLSRALADAGLRRAIGEAVRSAGYAHAAIDTDPFRSGNLNVDVRRPAVGAPGRADGFSRGRSARWRSAVHASRLRAPAGVDERAAPLLGGDVGERLGERPLVPGEILGRVLSLAVFEVSRLLEDARAVRPGPFAVGVHVIHADSHRVRHLTRAGRAAVAADVGDDHRAVAESELRAMVLADADALGEPECLGQPGDGLAYVRIDENGNDLARRDGAVGLHAGRPTRVCVSGSSSRRRPSGRCRSRSCSRGSRGRRTRPRDRPASPSDPPGCAR